VGVAQGAVGGGWWDFAVQWVASKGGSATTPQIAGIEHRQLVHKVFWPAYATINAVKALRRRRDMQKKPENSRRNKNKTEIGSLLRGFFWGSGWGEVPRGRPPWRCCLNSSQRTIEGCCEGLRNWRWFALIIMAEFPIPKETVSYAFGLTSPFTRKQIELLLNFARSADVCLIKWQLSVCLSATWNMLF